MLGDVPEVFSSLLQCDSLTPSRGSTTITELNYQRSAYSYVNLACRCKTFAYMFIYMGANMGYSHKTLPHLHPVIKFLSLLNLLYSWPSQGTLGGLHRTFVAASFHSAAYNTERVPRCLKTTTATCTHTPAIAMSVHPRTLRMSALIKPALSL